MYAAAALKNAIGSENTCILKDIGLKITLRTENIIQSGIANIFLMILLIISGLRAPDCYVLKNINEVTGLSVDYILGISETKNVAQSDSEALVEQVLVQDVIDSLKIFKKNYKASKKPKEIKGLFIVKITFSLLSEDIN